MGNLRIVRVPLLERVVLEDLADRWGVDASTAMQRVIREAAQREVVGGACGVIRARDRDSGEQEPSP